MNPVDRIREQRRLNTLQELVARTHRKRIVNLDKIRSIGIIAHNLSEEDKVTLGQFTNVMVNRGSMVRKIELPAISDNLIDKLGFPKTDFTQLFTTYQYDLLIDTTPADDIFGLYVTLTTSCNLRVGYIDTTTPNNKLAIETYDFIIRGNGPCELTHYLTEILNYLTQIRK